MTARFERALRQRLGGKLDYYAEHIDVPRFSEPGYLPAFRAFLRTKYERHDLDLIIAVDQVFGFLAPDADNLFPGVPIVFHSTPGAYSGTRATGVTSSTDFRETVAIALQLQPETQRIVVVSGASAWDKAFEARAREQFGGLGLVSITERVRLAGGTVSIVAELNKGTRVQVRIPVNHHPIERQHKAAV